MNKDMDLHETNTPAPSPDTGGISVPFCPYLATLEDPETSLGFSTPANHCFAQDPIAPVSITHQETHCLAAEHSTCPAFQRAAMASWPLPAAAERDSHGSKRGRNVSLFLLACILIALAALAWQADLDVLSQELGLGRRETAVSIRPQPQPQLQATPTLIPTPAETAVAGNPDTPTDTQTTENSLHAKSGASDTAPATSTPAPSASPTPDSSSAAYPATVTPAFSSTSEVVVLVEEPTGESAPLATSDLNGRDAGSGPSLAGAAEGELVEELGETAVVTAPALNVRSGPGVDYPATEVIFNRQKVSLLARNEDDTWVKIRLDDSLEGWVNKKHLVTETVTADLPVESP